MVTVNLQCLLVAGVGDFRISAFSQNIPQMPNGMGKFEGIVHGPIQVDGLRVELARDLPMPEVSFDLTETGEREGEHGTAAPIAIGI